MIGDKDASQRCGKIKTWNYIRINGLPQYETNHGVWKTWRAFSPRWIQRSGTRPLLFRQFPSIWYETCSCRKSFEEKALTLIPVSFNYRKFTDAKRCLRDLISTSCPNDTRTSSLEFALVFDDYNPFCEGSRDLGKIITYVPGFSFTNDFWRLKVFHSGGNLDFKQRCNILLTCFYYCQIRYISLPVLQIRRTFGFSVPPIIWVGTGLMQITILERAFIAQHGPQEQKW